MSVSTPRITTLSKIEVGNYWFIDFKIDGVNGVFRSRLIEDRVEQDMIISQIYMNIDFFRYLNLKTGVNIYTETTVSPFGRKDEPDRLTHGLLLRGFTIATIDLDSVQALSGQCESISELYAVNTKGLVLQESVIPAGLSYREALVNAIAKPLVYFFQDCKTAVNCF